MTQEMPFCKMEFITDEFGKELLLKDDEFQVMMEWEKPYMQACIEALSPEGDVLEIGFGCGYSATYIQEKHPRSHTIIEYHPVVAEKARAWAKKYPNVTIVEDTWQNAIHKLGSFDSIFFDDYPLESKKQSKQLEETQVEASSILSKGKKLLKKVQEKFSFLKDIKYKDEDVEYFFKNLTSRKKVNKEHFLPFFFDLKSKENITQEQFDQIVHRLQKEELITEEIKEAFFKKLSQTKGAFDFAQRGDRFFEFLEIVLKNHLRKEGRVSCYLESSESKYEDKKFFDHIITNPSVDYTESLIDIEVPSNCKYYKDSKALVAVITKRVD